MINTIDDIHESERLDNAVKGRTMTHITYDNWGENVSMHFNDGQVVVLSTLGCVEIESIKLDSNNNSLINP